MQYKQQINKKFIFYGDKKTQHLTREVVYCLTQRQNNSEKKKSTQRG